MPLKAYFDASGKDETPVITVGGYIAPADACQEIERLWTEATSGATFHLADFGRDKCKLASKAWTIRERADFLKRLSGIIRGVEARVISMSAETAVYNSVTASAEHPYITGPPYSGCALACVAMGEWLMEQSGLGNEEIAYTFELGDRQYELSRAFHDFRKRNPQLEGKRSLHFLPKKTTLLQPTDLIAGKVQEVLLQAYRAAGSLDRGKSLTPVGEFKAHYAADGTSAALLMRGAISFVGNREWFKKADGDLSKLLRTDPTYLAKVRKQFLQ